MCFASAAELLIQLMHCFHIRCGIKLHDTNAAFQQMKTSDDTENKEVIMHYFNSKFKYQSIVHFLKKFHKIVMSVRTLKSKT